ncbi:DNA mismatch repair protein MutS [Subsaximicrobium wynnwilliamsii]|uniref:DNA mismatch repair protein MutS n=1 Tax=Subsaximicrobium wynnwilliamsii TaxID=291179 RepID=A0A5C6ZL46_9FLAO|nr:DNA mismatch repair protein MutS [Subsaximicrobium wynnwilliamsii]TXD83750.1 DNA mismatch repair protein MutS [Subsaximicrobium wynnwilliamsii]TXD89367.1 DNA mismatch repair protein MutS [Subsaximicrobium wynnwilliamsii]TXE03586.1 DNA mismatch repair protein MutS [Subsaximicrobium wynnwilliamsii]
MKNPKTYYQQQLEFNTQQATGLKKRLLGLSTLRLIVFMATAIAIYFAWGNYVIMAGIAFVGIALFIVLLVNYNKFKSKKILHEALADINQEELLIIESKFHHRKDGMAYQDTQHFYSWDIDLFGRGSFFQYMNRTATAEGGLQLAQALKANDIKSITERQLAITELSEMADWSQLYAATASLVKTETSAKAIMDWLKNHKPFIPKFMLWFPQVFSVFSIVLFGLCVAELIDFNYFGYWLFVGLLITGRFLKNINTLANNSDKTKNTFKQYASLLDQIEQRSFSSQLLQAKQAQIQSQGKKASAIFKSFSKKLDALDNRSNLISALFGNGYLLLDIKNAYQVERWIGSYAQTVEHWFEAVAFFDAYNSLGTYAYNHQDHVFPELMHNKSAIEAKGLGHPLLNKTKRVTSDLKIDQQQFFIITGANMAGKSTFLRTVSLHIVMANVGLPVCASASKYAPIKLITSMRTSDSLTDDSSYFYSELTRLKFIVDAIVEEPYFIILDEILKGTNSTDKAIGSKKFVEKLVAGKATGIIATHDLSLCSISEALDEVENYYFDAEIIEDELYFDYKLKIGVCKNMNASFLLRKMEIVD